jgi:hypothetical protein
MGLRGELFGVVARFVCSVRGAHVTREIMNFEVAKADSTNVPHLFYTAFPKIDQNHIYKCTASIIYYKLFLTI